MPLGNSIPPWAPQAHWTWPGAKVMNQFKKFIFSYFFHCSCPIGSLFMTYIPSGCHFGSLIDRPHHFVGPRNWSNPNMSNTHHTHTRADTVQYFHLSPLALSCSISANLLIARKATPCRTFNVHNQHCTKKQEQS